MIWKTVKLGDYCKKIGSGATPKGGSMVYISQGTSLIRSQNVYNLYFEYSGLTHITKEAAQKLDGVTIQENDILLNITGDSVARVCIVPIDVIPARVNQHVAIIRPNTSLNAKYLVYYLASPKMQAYMLNLAVGKGASRNALTKGMIEDFPLVLPPIETQKKIADILSAYDDLIENNQKQIKLLEEAAQRLYKEWFIDLHFPGHESTPIIDGIPQCWKKVPLGEVIEYEIGGGWGEDNSTEKCDKQSFVIRGTDLYDITHGKAKSIPCRYQSESSLKSRILQDGDVVFEVSGGSRTEGVARTTFITQSMLDFWKIPVICASFCKLIRFKDKKLAQYMYDTLQYLRISGETVKYDKRSASSIVNYRWKDFLIQQEILVPTNEILEKYNALSINMYSTIISKSQAMETAAEARDRLLPKLMNGEIEVGMDKKETVKIDKFENIRKHWKAVPYDEDLPLAARSTGDISEETLEKLKEIAEEE